MQLREAHSLGGAFRPSTVDLIAPHRILDTVLTPSVRQFRYARSRTRAIDTSSPVRPIDICPSEVPAMVRRHPGAAVFARGGPALFVTTLVLVAGCTDPQAPGPGTGATQLSGRYAGGVLE